MPKRRLKKKKKSFRPSRLSAFESPIFYFFNLSLDSPPSTSLSRLGLDCIILYILYILIPHSSVPRLPFTSREPGNFDNGFTVNRFSNSISSLSIWNMR
ncbi:hypothetical protein DTO006G1_5538 [Penicillium roqueforti]|uniref:uncharacterized protein n=1 Tax=Penicillium roqueforti TaxID=5082 RepID=UPI00190CE918|nr:uncharacterized protein LCP9604111_8674 [Penicillium roqueforti]KAF9240499.1 hypothetical protein LCP9604111_8674 [Penicillium roqueforti]KAI1830807.1 hypothetical protein CBS147337_8424 [Penicillium roqueforti]KAI2674445.1 hypothetical protein CBS147355_7059 [Penicillium roqueforti]KAI2683895.1 hypothetical protein LCP963914a_5725 [Penicillium roqueforti]KAI2710973.1 hypothetical protein CBS147318_8353 [Penicillium roqueforti]